VPHDLRIATVGGLILWFGWHGFNPGSTLSEMDFEGIGRIAANTTLAACAAGLSAMFYAYPKTKTWDVSFTVNGFLAGLVAITCPCYWVSPTGSIILGAIAGVIVVVAVGVLGGPRLRDPVRAGPVTRGRGDLGHAVARPVRVRPVWRHGAAGSRQLRPADRSLLRWRLHRPDRADDRQRGGRHGDVRDVLGDVLCDQRLRRPACVPRGRAPGAR